MGMKKQCLPPLGCGEGGKGTCLGSICTVPGTQQMLHEYHRLLSVTITFVSAMPLFPDPEHQGMEASRWWLLVPALTAVVHCLALVNQEDSDPIDPNPLDSPARPALPCHKLSVSNIDFAFNLYRQLALEAPGENILFSPASVSLALAVLLFEAPAASRAQLLEGLGFNLTTVSEAEIQEGFQDLLLRLPVQDPWLLLTVGQHWFNSLGLGAIQDPVGAQKCIREYVEKQTQGKLGAGVEELRNETAAVLVNHMLLRGKKDYIQCGITFWELGFQSYCSPAPYSIWEASSANLGIRGTLTSRGQPTDVSA